MAAGPVGRRRLWDIVAVFGGAVLVGLVALTFAAVGDPGERVHRMWLGAELQADGSARITEVIDYVFADGPRHGIYREVPGSEQADSASVRVTMDGEPVPFDVGPRSETWTIKIGDPDTTVTGTHRYRIEYTVPGLGDPDLLTWNAVGTGWEVPIEHVEVHLTSAMELLDPNCVSSSSDTSRNCDVEQPAPGRLDVVHEGLDDEEGLTLYADRRGPVGEVPLPEAPIGAAAPVPTGDGLLTGWLWAAGIALAAAFPIAVLLRMLGRERVEAPDGRVRRRDIGRLAASVEPSPEPPVEIGPAHAAILLTDRVRRRHQAAWLLGAAADGRLSITGSKKRPVLRRTKGAGATDPDGVLDTLFAHGGSVQLGRYNKNFSNAWKLMRRTLRTWRRDGGDGLWEPSGTARRHVATWLGLAVALAGAVVVAFAAIGVTEPGNGWRSPVALGATLAGAGIAAVLCAWELRARTPRGSRLWCETEAYRRHLAALTPSEWATGNQEAMNAWAVALGQTATVLAASQAAPGSTGKGRLSAQPEAAAYLHVAAMQATVVPSSGGSSYSSSGHGGGSGGGDSGGGGGDGGGGGGSW